VSEWVLTGEFVRRLSWSAVGSVVTCKTVSRCDSQQWRSCVVIATVADGVTQYANLCKSWLLRSEFSQNHCTGDAAISKFLRVVVIWNSSNDGSCGAGQQLECFQRRVLIRYGCWRLQVWQRGGTAAVNQTANWWHKHWRR